MKNFRLLFLFIAAMAMTFSLVSCGDDDEEENTPTVPTNSYNSGGGNNGGNNGGGTTIDASLLVGTWEFVDGVETVIWSYQGQDFPSQTINFDRETIQEIARENNFGIWDEVLYISENTVNGQEYQLRGNVLMSYTDAEEGVSFTVTVKDISTERMVLNEVIHIDNEGVKMDIDADMNYAKRQD